MPLPSRTYRHWRLRSIVAGHRLEFRDGEEQTWTNAGNFRSVEDAVKEANKG